MPLIPFSATTTLRTATAQGDGRWGRLPTVEMSWLTIRKDGGGNGLEVAAAPPLANPDTLPSTPSDATTAGITPAGNSIVLGASQTATLYGSNANQFMIRKVDLGSTDADGVGAYLTIVNESR